MTKLRKIITTGMVLLVSCGVAYGASGVPEIDPGMATGAMTLLVAGVMILTARVRR